ncbi:MAG: hypothetical protein GEU96_16795, partial [Propionibacteriales bacterium]|nr:hypothetical protein [Propionibacteriales bacterium]
MTVTRFGPALLGAVVIAGIGAVASVPAEAAPQSAPRSDPDLDVLFIGAHPDDEAGRLSTYGQWNEYEGMDTGVITITRGEGGGNAV